MQLWRNLSRDRLPALGRTLAKRSSTRRCLPQEHLVTEESQALLESQMVLGWLGDSLYIYMRSCQALIQWQWFSLHAKHTHIYTYIHMYGVRVCFIYRQREKEGESVSVRDTTSAANS